MTKRNRGFFLILVAAVVAALAAILVQFGVDAQLDTLSSGNFRDEAVARQGAKSVLEGAKIAIERDHWQGLEVIPFISKQMLPDITCKGWIEDEEGKLPVNRLVQNGTEGMIILRRYWEERKCSIESLNALIDWIDADDTTVYGESEVAFYGKCGGIPLNRPLQSIFGLSVIPFMKREIERLKKLKERPIYQDLTVWGSGKINLLTADSDVLMSLSDDITPEMTERILLERKLGHIQTMGDFKEIINVPTGVFSAFLKWGTLRSTTFRVHIEVSYRKVHVVLTAVLWRQGQAIKTIYFREGLWQPA